MSGGKLSKIPHWKHWWRLRLKSRRIVTIDGCCMSWNRGNNCLKGKYRRNFCIPTRDIKYVRYSNPKCKKSCSVIGLTKSSVLRLKQSTIVRKRKTIFDHLLRQGRDIFGDIETGSRSIRSVLQMFLILTINCFNPWQTAWLTSSSAFHFSFPDDARNHTYNRFFTIGPRISNENVKTKLFT